MIRLDSTATGLELWRASNLGTSSGLLTGECAGQSAPHASSSSDKRRCGDGYRRRLLPPPESDTARAGTWL
jgi:hypothetical protein